ncbi:4-alpha-glucanotransferase [Roseomonas sp. BN140053]|uniref:4-alpha-glucanotransferase n=1 Tax=Roseomonas sp. BN140053 TaxID=3391898 RepID=UPI0039E99282
MSDDALRALAEAAGIELRWRDAHGDDKETAPEAMRAVLQALGLPTDSEAAMREGREELAREAALPPLCTAVAGQPVRLGRLADPAPRFKLTLESGATVEGTATPEGELCRLCTVEEAGYHHLVIGDRETTLAVAPARGFEVSDAAPGARPWGTAVQLYGLRRPGDAGLGDFAALAQFARAAARKGADAVAISPVHAQFSADPERSSPYAPSSRLFLNVLHADPAALGEDALREALASTGLQAEFARLETLDLVDWPASGRARLAVLRALFDRFPGSPEFERFRREGGEALESHARFEALQGSRFAADPEQWNWRKWPAEFRDPQGPGVERFARENAREVEFHAFAQWLAARGLDAAQVAAKQAGARIGLIADLAVGTDGSGSHGWSRPREMLRGLTVGAPPDIFSPLGQSWGLAAFSPRGLKAGGYAAFLEMLRAAMRHAGGVRIDHAMGLQRLWMVPDGASAAEGAYLRFPVDDMLRLVALESHRNRAVVVGEDLGTVPEGFTDRIEGIGMLGMRVLWFEQDEERGFTPPASWTPGAMAMTTTHDLPTVAGWWRGRDIEWRVKLGLLGEGKDGSEQREERERDRAALWQAMRDSGAAQGEAPPPEAGEAVADAAVAHVAGAACALALIPVEDVLALPEQPNLPGTTEGHPNWQRRLPGTAETLLDEPGAAHRLDAIQRARTAGPQGVSRS